MGKWKKFTKSLEDSFAASAFAEAGEFEAAKSIIDVSNGWVVLAGQGMGGVSEKICAYIKSLCESTKSALQIIWKGSLSIKDLNKMLGDVPFEVVIVSGDLESAIYGSLRKLRRVVSVVLTGEKRKFRSLFKRFSSEFVCPLVVISEKDIKG